MYLVITKQDGITGAIYHFDDCESAIQAAVSLAQKQCFLSAEEIRESLNLNQCFVAPHWGWQTKWEVELAMSEDWKG